LEELAVLWTEGEHEPVLDPRHLLVREATVESHSAGAKASDRLGDEVWHTAIMPHEPHSHAALRAPHASAAGSAQICRCQRVATLDLCDSF
jgi:hypothetical protein